MCWDRSHVIDETEEYCDGLYRLILTTRGTKIETISEAATRVVTGRRSLEGSHPSCISRRRRKRARARKQRQ